MNNLSRRGLIKGALATAGAVAGSRIAGPFVRDARAAVTEPSHFVHIYFNGGFNALFAGQADKFAGKSFGVTTANMLPVGNGVFTDREVFAGISPFALAHWGAFGMKHNQALHTTPQNLRSGGERAILINGTHSYLNELAFHMGGDSAYKAVYMGDRGPAYQANLPKFHTDPAKVDKEGVPLTRVSDLKDALRSAGSGAPNADAPDRAAQAAALETSRAISQRQLDTNPGRLSSLGDAYESSIASLKKPSLPPVTFAEIDTAYKLGGNSSATNTFGSMLAGAEIMIRAAGTNVVNICDFNLASWDFHQTGAGGSLNGSLSRDKFLARGVFSRASPRIEPIKTFIKRMLEMPGHNVVVAISGELVRLPSGDHGDGTVAAMFGKYIKQGVSHGIESSAARFNATKTPGPKGFWAAAAAALKVPGEPFGPNPHATLIA